MEEKKVKTGVTPVFDMTFGLCLTGRPAVEELETAEYTVVKDATGLAIAIDGKVEEWNPMDTQGWTRRLMTAKSINVSMGGKRNYGDPGNDYVAGLSFKMGQDVNNALKITFPNQDALIVPCVVNVTSMGGESTAIDALEWEAQSDGKPIYVTYPTV